MRKLIAGLNMTLDGFCDHTAMIADDEIHQHYNDAIKKCRHPYIRKDNISTYGKLLAICRKKSYR